MIPSRDLSEQIKCCTLMPLFTVMADSIDIDCVDPQVHTEIYISNVKPKAMWKIKAAWSEFLVFTVSNIFQNKRII